MVQSRVTIADVAARAGVSIGAVSFALNGRAGVSEETRQRILDVAREMGWSPSQRGRSLAASRAFAFGLVLARPPELLGSDPFYAAFIAGTEAVLSEAGYALLLQVPADPAAEEQAYRRLASEGRVDGVLLSDLRWDDSRIRMLAEIGLPTVTLNRPDVPSPFPAVSLEGGPGIAAATRHLLELGHTNIAHVTGPPHLLHSARRRYAWSATLAAAGVPEGPVAAADFTASGGANATRQLLARKQPPTAIVYGNDLMAMAGMAAAHESGFPVPERLSVTGFDDAELAAHVRPALTTVRTSPFEWGQAAARTLLQLIGTGAAPDIALGPPELVIRASTAPPGDEPLPAHRPAIPRQLRRPP
jgi:DNA-binding LacI/PurR family transcriptional regulator